MNRFPHNEGRNYFLRVNSISLICKMKPWLKNLFCAVLAVFSATLHGQSHPNFSNGFYHSTEGIEFAQRLV
ncbi:MAG: hypothetical protein EBT60_07700, partial [Bacteroidetes bacterium]|nr:hypothetical protein [Bacteroidota bacterium]